MTYPGPSVRTLLLCAALLGGLAQRGSAQSPQVSETTKNQATASAAVRPAQLRIVTRELANGLRLVMAENHDTPIINMQVWYHVSSKDET